MAKKRQADSPAVAEAREELAAIVSELRSTKGRTVALVRKLRRAAETAEIVGTDEFNSHSVESWIADILGDRVQKDLTDTARFVGHLVREDIRAAILEDLARDSEEADHAKA